MHSGFQLLQRSIKLLPRPWSHHQSPVRELPGASIIEWKGSGRSCCYVVGFGAHVSAAHKEVWMKFMDIFDFHISHWDVFPQHREVGEEKPE
jgi:hypothetical protein